MGLEEEKTVMPTIELAALILFVTCIVVFAIFRWEPRIPIAIALILLAATAIVNDEDWANHFALYAFYLLAAGMVLLLVQHIRERRPKD